MLLKAAINGARRRDEHPRLPFSPEEQARAAADAIRAGAHVIHAHVRDASGAESLQPEDVASLVRALRALVPAPIGVSTGAWIVPDPAERADQISRWTQRPDFASVNFSEDGAEAVAEVLLGFGVGVEAGLTTANDARRFAESGLASRCLRVMLEPQEQDLEHALRSVDGMEEVLDLAGVPLDRVLHGVDATAWPLLIEAFRRGYGARIGLEDTLVMPDGTPAVDNAALVAAGVVWQPV